MQFTEYYFEQRYSYVSVAAHRIGILGGTFNPVHNGHLVMAKEALEEFSLSSVIFIPSGNPPHKANEHIAPAYHRINMLETALFNKPQYSISTLEIQREGYSYTVDTMLELLSIYPEGTEFYFIIGSDSFFGLTSWKNYRMLLTLCDFIVFNRVGFEQDKLIDAASYLISQGARIHLASALCPKISSTEIRKRASQDLSLEGLVPKEVEDYIYINGLYRNRGC